MRALVTIPVAALLLLGLLVGWVQGQNTQPASTSAGRTAVVITLGGTIDDFQRDAFFRRVEQAKALNAQVIIIRLNTYGGMVTSGLDISRYIRGLDIPTIAFIDDKAISAGTMIALACNQIIMKPSAMIGDCAPIAVTEDGQLVPMPATERQKHESPIKADFDASAERNGYNRLLVESMIRLGTAIHWVENDAGERRFVTESEYQRLSGEGWNPVGDAPNPVVGAEELLTVDSKRAVQYGLARGTATSVEQLASAENLQVIAIFTPSAGDKLIELLNTAAARSILLTIFMLCLYISLHAPGHGAAEVLAVLTLAALLGVPLLTGYAQWWEIAIILLGIGLLALELFVIPGFGITGISGIVLVLVGLVMTFVAREPSGMPGLLPTLPATWNALQRGLIVVAAGMTCSLILSIWLRRMLPRMPYLNRLILATPQGAVASGAAAAGAVGAGGAGAGADHWPAIGATGTALTDLLPGGSMEIEHDGQPRVISVVSDSGYIERNSRLKVCEVEGSRVVVRKA